MYASAQSLDFFDLAENGSFLNWKLTLVSMIKELIYGWTLNHGGNLSHFKQIVIWEGEV